MKKVKIFIFYFLFILVVNQNIKAQESVFVFESVNDSIDISNNFYDFSDSLLHVFQDTSYFSIWDTSNVHNVEKSWNELGDSIMLPLLLSSKQKYVHPYNGIVTSKYGPRKGRFHYGTDIDLNDGDTVYASFDGIIRYAAPSGGYGNVIVIRHFNGLETLYAHLSNIFIENNKLIFAGDPIGLGGGTGRSYGSHLHYEIRFRGVALNPQELIDFDKFYLKTDTLILYKKDYTSVNTNTTNNNVATVMPKYHTVRKGETLGGIATKNGTTITNICNLNNIKRTSVLRIGQKLRIR